MLKITVVIPYWELDDAVRDYLSQVRHEGIQFDTTHIVGTEEVQDARFDCDIIISRGITCAALNKYHSHITNIEIPVTGYDVIAALHECKLEYGARKIAVVGSGNMIFGSRKLNHILDVEVMVYPVENENDTMVHIKSAKDWGAEAIIGGTMTYNFSLQQGIPATYIKSGEDAIKQAVDEAVRTGEIMAKERERARFFQIIMDYTHEGIIAVDREGMITAANSSAGTMYGRDRELLGQPVGSVLSSDSLRRVLTRGEEDLGALEVLGENQVAANFVPIKVDGRVSGAVATMQNVSRIVEMENKIRKKILSKGHVAKYTFNNILGNSSTVKDAIQTAQKYSRVDANVLIYGETGTGKELFANSIHQKSSRSAGPFVAINCAALPEQLLESELFGYAEGAFTGAMKGGKQGLFETAHKGTIFLDEIGEIPLTLQAKLLRVLQEREIMRIGDDRVIPVDVRIIAATNKNLRERVREGEFRQDILFRLDVLRINVPPLRDRTGDVDLLIDHYIAFYRNRMGFSPVSVSPEAKTLLRGYDWPGNIRELTNLCERLSALTEGNEVQCDSLSGFIDYGWERGTCPDPATVTPETKQGTTLRSMEQEAITAAIEAAEGNLTRAAKDLGISRTTLYRKCRQFEN